MGDACNDFEDPPDGDEYPAHALAQCEVDRDAAQARVAALEAELGTCQAR